MIIMFSLPHCLLRHYHTLQENNILRPIRLQRSQHVLRSVYRSHIVPELY